MPPQFSKKICQNCGGIYGWYRESKFCSEFCRNQFYHKRSQAKKVPNLTTKHCKSCDKEFSAGLTGERKGQCKFCSVECRQNYYSKPVSIVENVNCSVCGLQFSRWHGMKNVTCSEQCSKFHANTSRNLRRRLRWRFDPEYKLTETVRAKPRVRKSQARSKLRDAMMIQQLLLANPELAAQREKEIQIAKRERAERKRLWMVEYNSRPEVKAKNQAKAREYYWDHRESVLSKSRSRRSRRSD